MDNPDSLAAATLAAARCASTGQTEVAQYFEQFVVFEEMFKAHRDTETRARSKASAEALIKMNE